MKAPKAKKTVKLTVKKGKKYTCKVTVAKYAYATGIKLSETAPIGMEEGAANQKLGNSKIKKRVIMNTLYRYMAKT